MIQMYTPCWWIVLLKKINGGDYGAEEKFTVLAPPDYILNLLECFCNIASSFNLVAFEYDNTAASAQKSVPGVWHLYQKGRRDQTGMWREDEESGVKGNGGNWPSWADWANGKTVEGSYCICTPGRPIIDIFQPTKMEQNATHNMKSQCLKEVLPLFLYMVYIWF